MWHVSCATAQYPPRAYLIVNNNTEPSSATPFTGSGFTWRPSRPDYLPDLRNVVVPDSNKHNTSIIMDISQLPTRIFSYMVWDGMKSLFEAAMPTAMINYGEVHEVSVTSNHPWHLHIYNLMVSKHWDARTLCVVQHACCVALGLGTLSSRAAAANRSQGTKLVSCGT